MTDFPELTDEIPDILPLSWEMWRPDRISLSIAPLDEFRIPMNRRGIVTRLPSNPAQFEGFADAVAASVRSTIINILEGKP